MAAIEGPRFDESRTFQLTHEMRCRLTGDQEASAYLAGMEPVDVVEQFHDLDLCEGDAELEEGLCETRSQDPVDAAVCVDDPASRGGRYRGDLEAHGRFLPCADDMPSVAGAGVWVLSTEALVGCDRTLTGGPERGHPLPASPLLRDAGRPPRSVCRRHTVETLP